MTPEQQESLLAIVLFAAFADGDKDEREREQIRRISESLGGQAGAPDLARVYQDVMLKRVTLESAVARQDPDLRPLAYEMAVCVCDADGRQTESERRFLDHLRVLLELDAGQAQRFEREADAIVELGEAAAPAAGTSSPATGAGASPPAPMASAPPPALEAELDKTILNYALVNGALELLPQSWAGMAIIPLQIKMVYRIGRAHGVELDQGHIKEFIGAAGVGLTSQYLEQFGRKLLGGLLGKAAGRTVGRMGGAATGMAFSFATTYALGQLARRYYAGGRVMNSQVLRDSFQNLLGPAKQMQADYLPQIREQASTLDMSQVMSMVRGR